MKYLSLSFTNNSNQKPQNPSRQARVLEISPPTFVSSSSEQARRLLSITSSPTTPTSASSRYGSVSIPSTPVSAGGGQFRFQDSFPTATNISKYPVAPLGNAGGKIAKNSWLEEEFAKDDAKKAGFLNNSPKLPPTTNVLGYKAKNSIR
jgi:hypothetical protein